MLGSRLCGVQIAEPGRPTGRILRGPRTENQRSVSLGVHYVTCLTQHGDKIAQVQEVDGKDHTRTYSELLVQGKRFACFLRENGVGLGDTVWVSCGNTLAFTPILLGTVFVGAAVSPVLPLFASGDMLHLLRVIQPKLVIANSQSWTALSTAVEQCSMDIKLIPMDTVVLALDNDYKVDDFKLTPVEDPSTHVALVLCSSGTSGKPKGVEVTDKAVVLQADFPLFSSEGGPFYRGKVLMNLSNPNWITAQVAIIISISHGMLLVLMENFTEEAFLNTVQKHKVNFAILKPFELAALAKWPDTELYDTSSLEGLSFGGSSANRVVVELARERLHTDIVTVYGMTETMGVIKPPWENNEKSNSMGNLGANVDAKIVHFETRVALGPGEEGELCLRTPSIMKGYRNNPEETLLAFDEQGFYCTGDSVHYDQDGYFYFRERIKDIIKYKKHQQICAGDIEEVLMAHAGVKQACVVGIPHDTDYERATAFVVRQPGSTVTAQEILDLVEGKLPSYKWLHGGVRFLESLPKTASGKILKRELRALP